MTSLPGPRGNWLVGSIREISADRLGFFTRCRQEYGDAVAFRVGFRRAILLSHPDDIERVLVTDNRRFIKNFALQFLRPLLGDGLLLNEHESWLRQRRLIQPAFSKLRIEAYAPAMLDLTQRMLQDWQAGLARGESVRNIGVEMLRLTMAIAGKTLLDADVAGDSGEVTQCLEALLHDFLARFRSPIYIPFWLPTPANLKLKRTVSRLDRIIHALIDERRKEGAGRGDLLSLLIQARDENDGSGMTDKQLRDEVMTLFLAGHETTANALTWAIYLLGEHPEIQAQAAEGVRGVLAGRPPIAADAPRLELCERIIREAMRLYPPAYVIGRRATEDCHVGRFPVPQGTNVLMSQWVVQRDPRWYERPADFLPQRWADGSLSKLPKYAYFPFGGGPRICVGAGFAMLEAVLVLSSILQHYELSAVNPGPVPLLPAVTLRPGVPIQMRIIPRRPSLPC